jgi:DNA-binding SARP family transcriptional activator
VSKRRDLLAMLVLRSNCTVPAADLIDGLWGADPPPSAVHLVQTYVPAWRKALEPHCTGRGGGGRLFTTGPGYRLRVEPGELDLDQFTEAVADGLAAAAAGNHQAAAAQLIPAAPSGTSVSTGYSRLAFSVMLKGAPTRACAVDV